MAPVLIGEQKLEIELPDQKLTVDVTLESELGSTVILMDSGRTIVVPGDIRYPAGDKNATVTFLDAEGKPTEGSATITTGSGKVEVDSKTKTIVLPEGSVSTTDGGTTIQVQGGYAYSLIFVQTSKGQKALFLLNSDNRRPVAGGVAAT